MARTRDDNGDVCIRSTRLLFNDVCFVFVLRMIWKKC